VLCEGITADVSLPMAAERIELYSLDESAKRKTKIEVTADGDKTILPLRPAATTVWYEVVVR
jgi:hypothetical protein